MMSTNNMDNEQKDVCPFDAIKRIQIIADYARAANSYIPEHMQQSAYSYLILGYPPGGFLTAVLCNDLIGAFNRADSINSAAMRDWAIWLYNIPCAAAQSKEQIQQWCKERQADCAAIRAEGLTCPEMNI